MSIKRALISVSDKSGIAEFARSLSLLKIEIISTGGTAKLLQEMNIPVTEVSDFTGYPEMMAGRVKTLNPKIHGGILARRGKDEEIMSQNGIKPIDLVVVNLYPFQETIKDGCSFEEAIEKIDIGGIPRELLLQLTLLTFPRCTCQEYFSHSQERLFDDS